MSARYPLFLLTFLVAACGSETEGIDPNVATGIPPVVSRIAPAAARAGDEVVLFGYGFSAAAPANAIVVGNTSTSATRYELVTPPTAAEIERLTFVIPGNTAVGDNSITVVVGQQVSNTNIFLTVQP